MIAIERDIYSVIEGNEVETCFVVVAGSVMSQFQISAQLNTNCKLIVTNSSYSNIITLFVS